MAVLEDAGDKGFGGLAVGVVAGTEGDGEIGLFKSNFPVIRYAGQHEAQKREPGAGDKSCTEIHGKDSGVDGMAQALVGAGADEFVIFLDGDFAAPVAAEVNTRKDGDADTERGDGGSDRHDPRREGKEAAHAVDGRKDHERGDIAKQDVDAAGEGRFGGDCGGSTEFCDLPVDRVDEPEDDGGGELPVRGDLFIDRQRGHWRQRVLSGTQEEQSDDHAKNEDSPEIFWLHSWIMA